MYKVGVLGYFAGGNLAAGGQSTKTITLDSELRKIYGNKKVISVDTTRWKDHVGLFMLKCIMLTFKCQNIIILPAENGIKKFAPLFVFFRFLTKAKIHYMVIGGWLPKALENNKFLLWLLHYFDGIYVETHTMLKHLNQLGLSNVYVIPNFKKLSIVSKNKTDYKHNKPYKLCTFSRVVKKKGIEDAISAIVAINKKFTSPICQLDIYGPIDSNYRVQFREIMTKVPNYIKYKGEVPFDKSVEILQDYYCLLFPTRYYTEGLPGTIIDAYSAGVPVIASEWQNAREFIEDENTGLIFTFKNTLDLENCICKMIRDQEGYKAMRNNCIEKAQNFMPENALLPFLRRLK